MRSSSNLREDDYGGSLQNPCPAAAGSGRCRPNVFGGDRVGVRLSPENRFKTTSAVTDPQTAFTYVAVALRPFNLAYVHVPRRRPSARNHTLPAAGKTLPLAAAT
ncbi:MAG: hypothetical protein IPL58_12755 [Betaproteobacteria bacterium]|uniref:NADH:flavin oxidoreductase/NADH oxidase N-terminal domain-containing protein n=1 Tax=Candidatus Proximibacter danicus TaxID=2954365 RepID=A0A9D7K332_9PROT|nr:hypothetical protein [Candidatus Proximibacter danicus]